MKPELFGELTEHKWEAWYLTMFPGTMQRHKLSSFYSRIKKSEILIDRFLSYPETLQKIASNSIEYNFDPINIGVHAELRLRLSNAHPSLCFIDDNGKEQTSINWLTADTVSIMETSASNSKKFDAKTFRDASITFSDFTCKDAGDWGNLAVTTPYLLAVLYDGRTVVEAIETWTKSVVPTSMPEFIRLVDNWDSVKFYPFEWAIKMI